ncbi:PREDICTED: uncharacterized protein LOC102021666 [Chinchilla lanigera]|uniref:uncharacterized protein LOC102021666 n=1 Tax=Chinchilla lanigera TaxID=34839 RepID=UPI000698C8BD|nr:PREDICTED: uncharacterized protein LOC102021666 [Chinchilla lanigera]
MPGPAARSSGSPRGVAPSAVRPGPGRTELGTRVLRAGAVRWGLAVSAHRRPSSAAPGGQRRRRWSRDWARVSGRRGAAVLAPGTKGSRSCACRGGRSGAEARPGCKVAARTGRDGQRLRPSAAWGCSSANFGRGAPAHTHTWTSSSLHRLLLLKGARKRGAAPVPRPPPDSPPPPQPWAHLPEEEQLWRRSGSRANVRAGWAIAGAGERPPCAPTEDSAQGRPGTRLGDIGGILDFSRFCRELGFTAEPSSCAAGAPRVPGLQSFAAVWRGGIWLQTTTRRTRTRLAPPHSPTALFEVSTAGRGVQGIHQNLLVPRSGVAGVKARVSRWTSWESCGSGRR